MIFANWIVANRVLEFGLEIGIYVRVELGSSPIPSPKLCEFIIKKPWQNDKRGGGGFLVI